MHNLLYSYAYGTVLYVVVFYYYYSPHPAAASKLCGLRIRGPPVLMLLFMFSIDYRSKI